jgi:Sulfotransferase domain
LTIHRSIRSLMRTGERTEHKRRCYLPIGRFDEAARKARKLKSLLSGEENASAYLKLRSKRREFRQLRDEIAREKQEYNQAQDEIEDIKDRLASIKQETEQIKNELRTAEDPAEISEYEQRKERLQQERTRLREELRAKKEGKRAEKIVHKKMKKGAQQEIFQLEKERRAAHEQWTETGALPDFVIIGGKKCGTTFLYHLLGQHPLVEPAASKELHFFDALFDEGIEWYRQCFPAPRWEDGRRTITGEASPYMANRPAPERMAKVVPEARLIALLRNPVERTYSDYQMVTRKDREHKTFEEAIGLREPAEAGEARTVGKEGVNSEGEDANLDDDSEYLSRSRYAEHLLRWSEFFPREQMLVLKCEDFFDNPKQTLKVVLEFLGLPEWEPEPSKLENKRNAGRYEDDMDPTTRGRLEEYFEPHNRRLYDYLGKDFGW